jgi:hypothetical protein
VGTARKTAESTWSVYEHLRLGHYKARKRGRRTIVDPQSVITYWKAIPFATFGVTPLPASLAAQAASRAHPQGRRSGHQQEHRMN